MPDNLRQLNPRIPKDVFDTLESEAKRKDIAITTFAGKIIEEYAKKKMLKANRGDLTVGKSILYLLMESNNEQEMEENTEKAAREILGVWKLQIENVTFDEFHNRIIDWHSLNNQKISFFEHNEKIKYVIKHDLGLRWSEFQCKMYSKIIKELGGTLVKNGFDEVTYTIEAMFNKR